MMKRINKSDNLTLLTRKDGEYLAAFREKSANHVRKVTSSRKRAMKELVDAGIYDSRHQLKEQYR